MKNIKVSIVTPAYNNEKYIEETINSILNQTHQNFEIIVVDDYSSDKTIELVEKFNDERIIILKNKENMGAAFSRNKALAKATGEYVAFLDADDIWLPSKLEQQLNYMISNNYDFSSTDYGIINEAGEKLGKYITAPKKITHKKFRKISWVGCLTVMYKRSIFPDLSIPDSIKKRNDYALWLKLSEKANCYHMKEITACYRKRGGSISSGSKIKLFKYHIALFEKLYGYNNFRAFLMASRNTIYYFWKVFAYTKKEKA
ncbi:MAG: putative teichuronic acid biosynthesis glycosyltransferase TuaG [Tenericutes bacterium ADurb.Bin239]|jgi:glycosyltransferase involved in cell wall biosynthesis|nr:MAG: putative teichuronic acid biosynthesis glycosyltransferase TuaG [Tenericutes bacterium ADurb.Bin239]